MGSAGYGEFGKYRISEGQGNLGSNEGASSSGGDSCHTSIKFIKLDDVATSEFYRKYNDVPDKGNLVHVRITLVQGRIAVELTNSAEILGNLPINYNYILNCLKQGVNYNGEIVSSGLSPIPFIMVNLDAN
jgi:hypothetical protein